MDTVLKPLKIVEQASTPATPASGYGAIYPKGDGKWYALNSSGVEVEITNTVASAKSPATKLYTYYNFS